MLSFPDFMTTAQDGGKFVNLAHRPSFLLQAESTPGSLCDGKDFMSLKNSKTPAGIEPATFRFVAQHNHCATAVPTKDHIQRPKQQIVFMF